MINIQSMSGVITNSSTEVFMLFDESHIKGITDTVNALLKVVDSDKTFDDLFEFRFNVDDYAMQLLYEEYEEYTLLQNLVFENYDQFSDYIHSLTMMELLDLASEFDSGLSDTSTRLLNGWAILAKTDNAREAAYLLSIIPNLFELDYCYG